jgi:hypothetical protein
VVLELERALRGEGTGDRAFLVTARAFEGRVVLHEYAVAEDGEVAGIEDLGALVDGATEDDIDHLVFPGSVEGVRERRIDAVDGGGETVGVGRIVVVVEDLDLHETHEKNAAVAAALTVALDVFRGGPFDVELAIAELFLGADVSRFRYALHSAILHDPL